MTGAYRDGRIHVLSEKCSTCVFRPQNLMHLAPGRLKDLVESNVENGSALTCHQTLPYGEYDAEPAVCRGFYDAHKTYPLQLADRLGKVEYDDPPKKKKGERP